MSDETVKDFKWLRELQKKSWVHHEPERWADGRMKSYGHSEDLPVSRANGKKALELFKKHQDVLVFEPGSGTFGFGVCITAYEVNWSSFPGVPTEIHALLTLTGKQLFPKKRQVDNVEIYKVFEAFTHTEENKERREKTGCFKEKLKDYSFYDY